jgi:hypothetical protein
VPSEAGLDRHVLTVLHDSEKSCKTLFVFDELVIMNQKFIIHRGNRKRLLKSDSEPDTFLSNTTHDI